MNYASESSEYDFFPFIFASFIKIFMKNTCHSSLIKSVICFNMTRGRRSVRRDIHSCVRNFIEILINLIKRESVKASKITRGIFL